MNDIEKAIKEYCKNDVKLANLHFKLEEIIEQKRKENKRMHNAIMEWMK